MQRHGWALLFHDCVIEQLQKLHAAARRAQENDPKGFESNANVKLFRALSQLMMAKKRALVATKARGVMVCISR